MNNEIFTPIPEHLIEEMKKLDIVPEGLQEKIVKGEDISLAEVLLKSPDMVPAFLDELRRRFNFQSSVKD